MATTLVLGGARSGKSAYALHAAEDAARVNKGRLIYIATAERGDAEMSERIARHQVERGSIWKTIEEPLNLAAALATLRADDIAVVDCLTLWMSNLLAQDDSIQTHVDHLVTAVVQNRAALWLVSNEVGWGIVPDNALARRFRDECGRLHQALAAKVAHVVLVAAGLPLRLK